jgi:molybdate transport system substrate-binding protein
VKIRVVRTAMTGFALLALLGATACGNGGPADQGDSMAASGSSPTAVSGSITVFAAASLTESFATIGGQFEVADPCMKVTFNLAGSSALDAQINQGALADVFASATPANMKAVTDDGNADGALATFAGKKLVIAVITTRSTSPPWST